MNDRRYLNQAKSTISVNRLVNDKEEEETDACPAYQNNRLPYEKYKNSEKATKELLLEPKKSISQATPGLVKVVLLVT